MAQSHRQIDSCERPVQRAWMEFSAPTGSRPAPFLRNGQIRPFGRVARFGLLGGAPGACNWLMGSKRRRLLPPRKCRSGAGHTCKHQGIRVLWTPLESEEPLCCRAKRTAPR